MSWQMVDGSSRRPRVNWAVLDHLKVDSTNGGRRSLTPKIVNPEALLHHIEIAIANAEYAQASRYLSHLFPSTPGIPASSMVRDSGVSVPQGPALSGSYTACHENAESRNVNQAVACDKYVKLTNRPRSASRFSLSSNELAATRQQHLAKQLSGQPMWNDRELASSDRNVIREIVQKDTAVSDDNFNAESKREDIFKEENELRITVAPSVLGEEDARKVSPEGLSTQLQGAADPAKFVAGRIVTNDVENCGQSFIVLQKGSEEKIENVDSDEIYDAMAADEAYRAGRSALSEGQTELALSLLQVASNKCPPDKHTALAKVWKLMAATIEMLEKQDVTSH